MDTELTVVDHWSESQTLLAFARKICVKFLFACINIKELVMYS